MSDLSLQGSDENLEPRKTRKDGNRRFRGFLKEKSQIDTDLLNGITGFTKKMLLNLSLFCIIDC